MGRNKEPDLPITNPVEAKKHRDEANGHLKNGNYDRALISFAKPWHRSFNTAVWRNDSHTTSVRSGISECENISSHHDDNRRGVDTDTLPHTFTLRNHYGTSSSSAMDIQAQARSILGPTKDAEFLASFVRVGVDDEEEEIPVQKASISKRGPQSAGKEREHDVGDDKHSAKDRKESAKPKKKWKQKPKRERRKREEELYTDKDRAAAVVMGSKDIKQSLNLKDKAEKSSALQLPVEADAGTLLALARAEMMRERYRTAVLFVNKAIELAPDEKQAYIARSKCYLLLGEPRSALADAESALRLDPKDAKSLLRKAEALYYCGEFEMSLVHYHRGLRARPDLNDFRLGVQKAQEAIENTIGSVKVVKKQGKRRSKSARPVLGQLNSDKIYLENLLKNPNLAIADKKNDIVLRQAEEAIRFLENREEFWRQQQTSGAK